MWDLHLRSLFFHRIPWVHLLFGHDDELRPKFQSLDRVFKRIWVTVQQIWTFPNRMPKHLLQLTQSTKGVDFFWSGQNFCGEHFQIRDNLTNNVTEHFLIIRPDQRQSRNEHLLFRLFEKIAKSKLTIFDLQTRYLVYDWRSLQVFCGQSR